jgi:hypothetical protein
MQAKGGIQMRKTLEVPKTSYTVREPAELTDGVAALSLGSDLAMAIPQAEARSQHNSAGSGTIRLKIRQQRSSDSERLEDHSDDDLAAMTTSWIQKMNQERIRNSEAAIISKVMQSTALPEFGLQRTERGLQVYIGLEERYWDGPPGSWIPSPPIWNCRRNYLFPVPQSDADKIPGITRYVIMRENGLYTPEEAALLRGMWRQYRNLKESQDPVNLRRSWNSPTYMHIRHINEYSTNIEDYLNPHSTMYEAMAVEAQEEKKNSLRQPEPEPEATDPAFVLTEDRLRQHDSTSMQLDDETRSLARSVNSEGSSVGSRGSRFSMKGEDEASIKVWVADYYTVDEGSKALTDINVLYASYSAHPAFNRIPPKTFQNCMKKIYGHIRGEGKDKNRKKITGYKGLIIKR